LKRANIFLQDALDWPVVERDALARDLVRVEINQRAIPNPESQGSHYLLGFLRALLRPWTAIGAKRHTSGCGAARRRDE
jgi:hypothetical protein